MRQVSIHNKLSAKFPAGAESSVIRTCDYSIRNDVSIKIRDYIYELIRFQLLNLVKFYTK